MSPLVQLLVQIAAIVVVGRLLARLFRPLGQPGVVAEVVAGVALGPSLLGLVAPKAMDALFPASGMSLLSMVAQLGLVFFMFLVGLEFDPRLLQGRGKASVAISWASIVLPFAMGLALAWPLHARLAPEGVPFASFALFMGASMSVTAFPVLARILTERGVIRTRVGAIALACAAVDDVTAWCMLAFVVAVARAQGAGSAVVTTALALVYVVVMLGVVRPVLARLGPKAGGHASPDAVAGVFVLLLVSALTTELIGIHALFGAFLFGAVMPRSGGLAHALSEKLEDFVTIVLLPLFFAYSGLRTKIGLLDDTASWSTCAAIVAVACAGKFGGSAIAARLTGLGWREAGAVGILMNTRGLMELVVLNMGLDLGVLSERLFAMMVIMALVTTWATSPLLQRIYPRERMARDTVEEPPPAPEAAAAALLCVSDPAVAPALVTLGEALARGTDRELLALWVRPTDRPSVYLKDEAPDAGPLAAVQARARSIGAKVRLLSYAAPDVAGEIRRIAEVKRVPLVLLGTHRALFGERALGGTVRAVGEDGHPDLAVLHDRGLDRIGSVAVVAADGPDGALARRLADTLLRAGASAGDPESADLVVAPASAGQLATSRSTLYVRARRGEA